MGLSSRPPTKRPVYRSEFVIRLQSMREKRGKNFAFDLLDEPIDWRPSPALSGLSLKILIKISPNLLSKFSNTYTYLCPVGQFAEKRAKNCPTGHK